MSEGYYVIRYNPSLEREWDEFINNSINGTFLQSRRFLNYHPEGRFVDNSYVVYDEKNRICALVPACLIMDGERKILSSHSGSTYGGIITSKKYYLVKSVLDIIETINDFAREEGFDEIRLKLTPSIFGTENNDMLAFCLLHFGYERKDDLNLYVDFSDYKDNVLSNFTQGKRTNVNNCNKLNVQLRKLEERKDVEIWYSILCETLEKYDRKPVHSLDEIMKLKDEVLKEECEVYGLYLEDKMIAGSLMFYFNNASIAHTQYLAALHEYDKLSPMTYMYYAMIQLAKDRGYKKISFGIATEDMGAYLNTGLIFSKECYGSKYSLNDTFILKLK